MLGEWRTFKVSRDGSVLTITLDHPESRNAASNQNIAELYVLLQQVAAMDDVAVVILTGAGRFFCPGADIGAVAAGDTVEIVDGEASPIYDVAAHLHLLPQFTLAAINGGCAGAGLGYALGCDMRVATAGAKFTTAFLNLGVSGDMCLPWTLPAVVGPARARQLSFLPDKFTATQALEWGLVTEVFPDDEFRASVGRLAERLGAMNPVAVRAMKDHYLKAEATSLAEYARYEAAYNATNFDPSGFEQRPAKDAGQ